MSPEALLRKRRKIAGKMRERIAMLKKHRDAFRALAAEADKLADDIVVELHEMKKQELLLNRQAPIQCQTSQ